MTLRHMRIFVQVYQTQNITKAAGLLHMTQPAVSRTIQELESYYGVQLFARIQRHLSVTEAGKELYQQAVHIVDSFDTLEKGLHNWDSCGILRIGASVTVGNYMFPEFLLRFRAVYPDVRVQSMILNSSGLQAALMKNELDLAIIEGTVQEPALCTEPFAQDEMCLILPPNHPLLQKSKIVLSDLVPYDLLMRESGSAGRAFVESVFAANNISFHPAGISISTQAIINMVHNGLGISILPEMLVAQDIASHKVFSRPIQNTSMQRKYFIAWHQSKLLSPAIKAFIRICKEPLAAQRQNLPNG